MKAYEQMDDDERQDFAFLTQGVLNEIRSDTQSERRVRPALIVLWAMAHGRTTLNLWTQYDIDPSGFIDEAIRKGASFVENLLSVMKQHPPPTEILRRNRTMRDFAASGERFIDTMRAARYRAQVVEVVDDFFREARERGDL